MSKSVVAALAFSLLSAFAVGQAPPSNDLCANAIQVFDGINPNAPTGTSGSTFTNVNAGTEDFPPCLASSFADVYFYYVATANGATTVSTCTPPTFAAGNNTDTTVTVYDFCGGNVLACNDDFCSFRSQTTFGTTAGNTYIIRVGGYDGTAGTFYLTLSAAPGGPSNDTCPNATQIFDGVNPNAPAGSSGSVYTNASASTDINEPCVNSGADVFFYYVATGSGYTTASCCTPSGFVPGTLNDTTLSIYDACAGSTIACNDDFCNFLSQVTFLTTAGNTYVVRVAGYIGQTGTFYVTISPAVTPSNDDCTTAIPVADGTTLGDNGNATPDSGLPAACAPQTNQVWYSYSYPGSCNGSVTVSLCPSPSFFDYVLTVYTGACGALSLVACDDDFCGFAAPSEVTFAAAPGTTYFIAVGSYDYGTGTGGAPFTMVVSHATASAISFGSSCPGATPTLSSTPPVLGGSVTISYVGGAPNAFADLFLSAPTAVITPIASCNVYLDFGTLAEVTPGGFLLDAGGNFTLGPLPLPNVPGLECIRVFIQGADFPAPNAFQLTNAVDGTLGY